MGMDWLEQPLVTTEYTDHAEENRGERSVVFWRLDVNKLIIR